MPRRPHTSRARAFTLTELLVAIGAVAILTVGIGRIFGSINNIVSRGGSIEEVEATARAIEQLMRRDFELLNRMNADETFIAIRSRELGSPERPIYHTTDDKRADKQAGVTPYDIGSLAITRRLDELVFIAGDSTASNFTSKQANGFYSTQLTQTGTARIYFGHGLRPKPFDPNANKGDPHAEWPPREPDDRYPTDPDGPRVAPRIPEPDGFFGDQPAQNDPSNLTSIDRLFGRNEFANDWPLVRHPVLLAGSIALGDERGNPTPNLAKDTLLRVAGDDPITGTTIGIAPTLLDRESYLRWWDTGMGANTPDVWDRGNGQGVSNSNDFLQMPVPRLLRHGRADVVAQSNTAFRQWIEGEPPVGPILGWQVSGDTPNATNPGNLIGALHGSAYDSGGWLGVPADPATDPNSPEYGGGPNTVGTPDNLDLLQSPLWSWGPTGPLHERIINNVQHMRAALANSIIRPIVEPDATLIDRVLIPDDLDTVPGGFGFTDNHAIIAAQCSNFEIAWSDGSYASDAIDIDTNGIPEYFPGDIIWFDITRVDAAEPNDDTVPRQTMLYFALNWPDEIKWTSGDVPILLSIMDPTTAIHERVIPEIDELIVAGMTNNLGLIDVEPAVPLAGNISYNPELAGGTPQNVILGDGSSGQPPDLFEQLVVWPFRKLSVVQNAIDIGTTPNPAAAAWRKPSLIRVRLTLHDRAGVLVKGKEYEFTFHVNLRNP